MKNCKLFVFALTLPLIVSGLSTLLLTQKARGNSQKRCSTIRFKGSTSKLYIPDSSGRLKEYHVSNSRSIRGWNYKGGSTASYIVFNGRESSVTIHKFNPNSGFGPKIANIHLSKSDSMLGWDWNERTGEASYMFSNSSGTFVTIQPFDLRGFGQQKRTIQISRSALNKYKSSWTWNGNIAEYTLNNGGSVKTVVQDFNGYNFNGKYPQKSQNIGSNIAGRSCY